MKTLELPARGLTAREAAARLAADGPNVLPGSEPKSLLQLAVGVLLEPMFLMLLVAGGIYLALGDTAEAIFLLFSVFAVIALALTQERKTQRALEALRDLSAPRAMVVRDGTELRIPSREVVRGDLLVLREGDRVPADAVLLQGQVSCDESLLTGEAAPVQKLPADAGAQMGSPGVAKAPSVFASTLVTTGVALARVRATAGETAVGRIGLSLARTQERPSSLQRASRRIVRALATAGLSLAVLLFLLAWQWEQRGLLDSLLLGIALAMAVLPEEIPVVLTVFLALGAWRLSARQVLTRRVQAVEALGGITVLAVDKTGTLTLNRMEVAQLRSADEVYRHGSRQPLPESLHELAEFALLATPADPFDPMEKAIRGFVHAHLQGTHHVHADWSPEHQYPLTPEILAMTHVFAQSDPSLHLLATKGAPEAVADLCHLPADALEAIRAQVQEMASQGLRVLAVARGQWRGEGWPTSQHDFEFRFLGLIGLMDPPRPQVPGAVAACKEAGIRILMLTGDHPATAQAVARQIGLQDTPVLTGSEIEQMDDAQLSRAVAEAHICARLLPHHKFRLVRALQGSGERVGMTGDGVNDAPALKAADVGIAMGERGTDVAREAAAIVLLDDSFSSIIEAIRHGRRIDDNIRAAMRFVFAVHVPVIALALWPALLHWAVLLLPAQIVLFQLIIDPACSVLFEAEPAAADLMQRPPHAARASPFAWTNLAMGALQGAGLAAVMLVGAGMLFAQGWEAASVRTAISLALVVGVFLLALVPRSRRRMRGLPGNPWIPRMAGMVAAVMLLVLAVPWLRQVMGLVRPGPGVFLAVGAMGLAAAAWLAGLQSFARLSRT